MVQGVEIFFEIPIFGKDPLRDFDKQAFETQPPQLLCQRTRGCAHSCKKLSLQWASQGFHGEISCWNTAVIL
jgi:hypothetical protein